MFKPQIDLVTYLYKYILFYRPRVDDAGKLVIDLSSKIHLPRAFAKHWSWRATSIFIFSPFQTPKRIEIATQFHINFAEEVGKKEKIQCCTLRFIDKIKRRDGEAQLRGVKCFSHFYGRRGGRKYSRGDQIDFYPLNYRVFCGSVAMNN